MTGRYAVAVRSALPLLLLAACGVSLPVATALDAQRAGVSVDELTRGRRIYSSRCSVCHAPHAPGEFPAARWPSLVAEMRERSKISADEEAAIERYLVTMAK
jgi:mono/diheme cytochrome c family protein